MSRSYRKPYFGNNAGAKEWKREANRKIRRNEIDVGNNSAYKKANEVWTSPMENSKGYWDLPRLRRK